MAGEVPPLNIKVTIDASGITTGVSKATAGLNQISERAKMTTGSFGKFKEMALGVFGGNILSTGVLGVTKVLEEMKAEVIATQAAQQRLSTAMDNTGMSSEKEKKAVEENAAAYATLGFHHSESINAMGTLITATHSVTQANKLMAMSADLARYKHIDMDTAAKILARGTQGAAKAFKELGITLDTSLPKNKAIAKAFDELNAKIGGQAQAYTKTFAGQLALLKEKFDGIAIAVGKYLIPIFSFLVKTISDVVGWIGQNSTALKILAGIVGTMVVVLKGWAAIQKVINLLLLENPIGLWIVAIAALSVAFVALWNHFKIFRDSMAEGLATIVQLIGYVVGGFASLMRMLSRIPKLGFLKGVADDADKAALSLGKVAKSVDDLKNKKLTAPKIVSTPTGSVKPGDPTGILGSVTGGGGGSQNTQFVTVYASNTNDIYKKLSMAAKTGVPIGGGK